MDCGCIYVGDYDPPELYRSTKHTARKNHNCDECGKLISVGEKYEYVFGIWEGKANVHKTCSVCLDIRRVFFCDGWIFEGVFEELHNHIQEVGGEISENCLIDLNLEAREVVCNMIEDYWGEE